MAFEIEKHIPNEDALYRHVPRVKGNPGQFWISEQNRPSSVVFRDKQRRVSVDWSKYKTVQGAVRPKSLAIVSITAGECRSFGKEVEHAPLQENDPQGPNQAHSEICDPVGKSMSDEEEHIARDNLARAAKLVWPEVVQL